MNETITRDQGVELTRAAVAECLARDMSEVQAGSRLITDLGADSLDFIDLIFTLEKRFGVKLRENDLNLMSRPDASGPEAVKNAEFLKPDEVERLLSWLPELANAADPEHVRPVQLWPLITVEALWRLVVQKTKSGPA